MANYPQGEHRNMSENETNTAPAETEAPTVEEAAPQGEATADWKAEARKWEQRAKADFDAANKWREYEVSQKTEYEKLADELSEYKAQAVEAQRKALLYEVASAKGIPAEALDLITGETAEAIEASADKLAALIAANQKTTTSPVPDANQGKPASAGTSAADQFAAALSNII